MKQTKSFEGIPKGLSFGESAYIVHSRIKGETTTPIALHASASLLFPLQYNDTATLGGKNACAFEPAKAAAYDYHLRAGNAVAHRTVT